MESRRLGSIEIGAGALLVIVGLILWWWSRQLLWILISPPQMAKALIEGLPFAFWSLGALLAIDGIRRKVRDARVVRSSNRL